MTFRIWLEQNRPQVEPNFSMQVWDACIKHVPVGTTIYRGFRIHKDLRKMTIRQILSQSFKSNAKPFDPWTLDFAVAQRFAAGAHSNADGTSGRMEDTARVIVSAKIVQHRNVIDLKQFGDKIMGHNVSKGSGINTYWQPRMIGKATIDDRDVENEIPILRTAYANPQLFPLTGYWTEENGQWVQGNKPAALS
ncbi:MAG: hypothetical protein M0R80_02165 [Proteobacteria bacterium]|jgi:hypothetical protein|nr:hypothetical protein [Pseudomonadota bacterium]